MADPEITYPSIPEEPKEVPSFYWDDNEDSEGYKEDGCPWIYTE